MRIRLVNGTDAELNEEAVQRLVRRFRGQLLVADSPGYEDARRIFNAAIDRRPALIARCTSVADVIVAIQFARDHDVLVAVRSGGHDIAGNSLCDGGLVVDLGRMASIHVNRARPSVRVEGGATWDVVDHETQMFGLATPGGTVSRVGVAGFTLGGGLGWLSRTHGLACDNLISADVVTTEGRLVTASSTENPDLFWGLRGGMGNFGIVTSVELQLHTVGSFTAGTLLFAPGQTPEVLERYAHMTAGAPDALASQLRCFTHHQHGPVVAVVVACLGGTPECLEALRPLRAQGPLEDGLRTMNYLSVQRLLDAMLPVGSQHFWRSSFVPSLSPHALALLGQQMSRVPAGECQLVLEHMGGAVARVAHGATAFAHRHAAFRLVVMGASPDPAALQDVSAWAQTCWGALRPVCSAAVSINHLSVDEGQDRVRSAYDEASWSRLAALKHKYDSTQFFRHTHVVAPVSEHMRLEAERLALQKDMELAAAVQKFFLPPSMDAWAPGLDVAALYRAAGHCSGDWLWYDLTKDGVDVVVADVTGHGAPSAMLTAFLASTYRALRRQGGPLDGRWVLEELHAAWLDVAHGEYQAATVALHINRSTLQMSWWLAGAPPFLVLHPQGAVDAITATSGLLGTAEPFRVGQGQRTLAPGDRVLVFTDGCYELLDPNGQPLGLAGLRRIFAATRTLNAQAARSFIWDQLHQRLQARSDAERDDITFAVVDIAPL